MAPVPPGAAPRRQTALETLNQRVQPARLVKVPFSNSQIESPETADPLPFAVGITVLFTVVALAPTYTWFQPYISKSYFAAIIPAVFGASYVIYVYGRRTPPDGPGSLDFIFGQGKSKAARKLTQQIRDEVGRSRNTLNAPFSGAASASAANSRSG